MTDLRRHLAGASARRRLPGVTLAVLLATACSDGATTEPMPDPDPTPGDPADAVVTVIVEGLASPVFITHAPGDDARLFIVEREGVIRILRDGVLLEAPYLDIRSITRAGGERGLLGLAFHPDFATNGRFFVNHTDLDGDTRILRFEATPGSDGVDPGTLQVVLTVDQPYANHNGGHLAFGPDGLLYIGLGDGGSGGDPDGNGQDPSTLLGSMLRIDVDELPYTIPPDNPFVADPSAAPETWAYGLRNPWRFSFDRTSGALWIADVGQNALEEVSVQPVSSGGGQNYGWNRLEGTACYATSPCESSETVLPVYTYPHTDGCSVTGGYVYRGAAIPALQGRYLVADYCGGWIRSLGFDGTTVTDVIDHEPVFGTLPGIVSFGEDANGEIYVVSLSGTIWRIAAPAP